MEKDTIASASCASSVERDRGLDAVYAHVEKHRDQHVARLLDYLRFPSISAHNIGIAHVAGILCETLKQLGFDVRLVETPGHPIVLARRHDRPGEPTVLLYGHYDVQPPEPLEAWTNPPFEPTIRDGRIYARGAGDNKGQHFAQLLAIESHLAVHGKLPCNVTVVLEGEEEVGSPHIAGFVKTHRPELAADVVVTADGPMHPSGNPIVYCGMRGIVQFDLHARFAARDLHSGNFGNVAPNPIWTLVHLLATMKNPDGAITIDGLMDGVMPPTERERRAGELLPLDPDSIMADLGLKRLDAPPGLAMVDRLMFRPTLTINGFHGGYGGSGSKTVLPKEATVKCDIRIVEAQQPDDVLDKVERHVARHAPDVMMIRRGGGMFPSRTPMDSPYLSAIEAAIRNARGIDPFVYPSAGGSLPEYVFTKLLGAHSFVIPYANADEANHAPDENLKLSCFYDGIRTGAALLTYIGAARVDSSRS